MKLLLDQNLSRKLVDPLQMLWPRSSHVSFHGLERATDRQLWDFARSNEFYLVSKDSDFLHMASLYGHPPKIIIISAGNRSTAAVHDILQQSQITLNAFALNPDEAVLILP